MSKFRSNIHKGLLTIILLALGGMASGSDPVITKLKPEREHGRGFRMVYTIDAPVDEVWDFKTRFGSQVLLKNKFITSHRLISTDGDVVITETVYANKPGDVFKWRTTVLPEQKRLEFELLNPEACGQQYHYGYVQLQAQRDATRVTHVAYFDFFGVSLWVNYPFRGGMKRFLEYTAQWEQQTIPAASVSH